MSLTSRQRDALVAIKRLTVVGIAPSYSEVRDALGLSSNSGVHRLVLGLEERGYLVRIARRYRSLELTAKGERLLTEGATVETTVLAGMGTPDLKDLIARACGVYAHRVGGGNTDAMLNRIGARLAGRPAERGAAG